MRQQLSVTFVTNEDGDEQSFIGEIVRYHAPSPMWDERLVFRTPNGVEFNVRVEDITNIIHTKTILKVGS